MKTWKNNTWTISKINCYHLTFYLWVNTTCKHVDDLLPRLRPFDFVEATLLGFHLFWVWAPPFAGATVPGQHLSRLLLTGQRGFTRWPHNSKCAFLGRQTSNTNSPTPIPGKRLREKENWLTCVREEKKGETCASTPLHHTPSGRH